MFWLQQRAQHPQSGADGARAIALAHGAAASLLSRSGPDGRLLTGPGRKEGARPTLAPVEREKLMLA